MWNHIKNIFSKDKNDYKKLMLENPLWFMDADIYKNESIFRNQPFTFSRFSKDNPATLGYLIKNLFPNNYDKIKEAVNLSTTSDSPKKITDIEEIKQIRPIEQTIKKNEFGEEYPKAGFNNVFVVIFNNSSDIKEVIFHFRGVAGYHCHTPYVRVSVMIPPINGDDALKTHLTSGVNNINNKIAEQICFIIVEDRGDNSKFIETYEAANKNIENKIKKRKKFNPSWIEEAIIDGYFSFKKVEYYIKYGDELMEKERWFDAYRQFIRAYNALSKSVLKNENNEIEQYRFLAHKLGICLTKLKRWDEAVYFLTIAGLEDDLNIALSELTSSSTNKTDTFAFQQQDESSDNHINKLTVGDLLSLLYGAVRNSLEHMVVTYDNSSENLIIDNPSTLWYTSLDVILKDKTTAIIGYSHVGYIINDNTDNSRLCSKSSFVIRTHKVKSDTNDYLMRMTIMLPPFNDDPDKIYSSQIHIPQGISFIIGENLINREEESYSNKQTLCHNLCLEKRYLELSFEAKRVFHSLINKRNNLTEDELILLYQSAYYVGFAYHDLDMKEKAYYYLRLASKMDVDFLKEYINCMVNLRNPSVPYMLENIIKDYSLNQLKTNEIPSDSFYYFLLRRKLWLLIEMNKLEEAKEVIMLLQDDPDPFTKQFIEKEKEYLYYKRII